MKESKATKLWVVQKQGNLLGPFPTEEVIEKIMTGEFLGDEKIRKHPDGAWMLISKEATFYEYLVNVALKGSKKKISATTVDLEMTVIKPKEKQTAEPVQAQAAEEQVEEDLSERTIISVPVENPEKFEQNNLPAISTEAASNQAKPNTTKLPHAQPQKIQINPDVQKKPKSFLIPMLMILAGLFLGLFAYFELSDETKKTVNTLISPNFNTKEKVSPAEAAQGLKKAVSLFVKDNYESLWEAQKILVSIFERGKENKEVGGTLCIVYRSLWPYVRQSTADLNAIQMTARQVKLMDPVGINGTYCEISYLMVQGKYQDAKGTVDYAMNLPGMSNSAVLYAFKSDLISLDHDYGSAARFYEKTSELWPEWVRPSFQAAINYFKAGESDRALEIYQDLLKKNPHHKEMKVEYGGLLANQKGSEDAAIKHLSASLSSEGVISNSTKANAYLYLAKAYSSKGDNKKALENANAALELNPINPAIKSMVESLGGSTEGRVAKGAANNELIHLGDQYFRAGDYMSAQAQYSAAFDMDSTSALAAKKAAESLWKINQYLEAVSWLKKAISADPKYATPYFLLADYHSQRYNYPDASDALLAGSKIIPQNFEIIRGLGVIEFRKNNFAQAIIYLEKSYKLNSYDIETLSYLGRSYLAMGELEKASRHVLSAIDLDGTNNEIRVLYGKILVQSKGIDVALSYMEEQIAKFSYTVDFRMGQAEIYFEAERFPLARQAYEQILIVDPKNKKATIGLGKTYRALNMHDLALKTFLRAAVLDPSDAEPLVHAGQVYMDTSKYREAIVQFQRGLRVNEYYPRANYLMGKAALLSGQTDMALKCAAEERKVNPGLAEAYILAAEIYFNGRDYAKCAQEYREAIKRRPKGAELYVKLARCQIAAGNLDIAEAMLTIAANNEPGYSEIYREQGIIFERKQDPAAAAQSYNKYLSITPDAPDKKEIEAKIQQLSK